MAAAVHNLVPRTPPAHRESLMGKNNNIQSFKRGDKNFEPNQTGFLRLALLLRTGSKRGNLIIESSLKPLQI